MLHGVAGGYQPDNKDWTIAQDWHLYTAQDHATWQILYKRQTKLLPQLACADFIKGMTDLPLSPDEIPEFDRVNEVLFKRTGWQIVAVPGLVPDEVFFEHLAHRRFPSGNFIRRPDQLDYLQEPDVFHDVFGHVPMLMNPVMADFICAYGKGGLRAKSLGALTPLARVYWYTVEFGLVREGGQLKLYGAGIASSFSESPFSLLSPSPNRIGFDLKRVMRTHYRIDDFQQVYFVLDGLDDLLALSQLDFAPIYNEIKGLSDLSPHDILITDHMISRGNQAYHGQNV